MSLTLAQDYEYIDNDRWRWWVWLDGERDELDRVEAVEYHLHPTFPDPIRRVTDKESRFRLEAQGWGVFQLKALAILNDGSVEQLVHMLELRYPEGYDENEAISRGPAETPSETSDQPSSVFLSAGTADREVAAELRESLTSRGVQVSSDEDIGFGAPWEIEIQQAMEKADALVVLSSDIPSSWVEREVVAATEQGTKVIPVIIGDNAVLPKSLESLSQIRLRDESGLQAATESIVRAING